MKELPPVHELRVPVPSPDIVYSTRVLQREISFRGLKHLLGAADHSKAGDRLAGLSAPGEVVREAAREILASLTLQHLYDHPLTDEAGGVDAVMRVNYDIDLETFVELAGMTLGELKDHLLRAPGREVARAGGALTA
jgi:ethanolamine ammonia-lyase large subunit